MQLWVQGRLWSRPQVKAALVMTALCLPSLATAQQQAENHTYSTAGISSSFAETPGAQHVVQQSPIGPQPGLDIGLYVFVAVSMIIASSSGFGGGGLVVPGLILLERFSAVTAVALSNMTITAAGVANIIINMPRKGPSGRGPLIDWDLTLMLGPPLVLGAMGGSYINFLIPGWVTEVVLVVLLFPTTWRMIVKAKEAYRKETVAAAAASKAPAVTQQLEASMNQQQQRGKQGQPDCQTMQRPSISITACSSSSSLNTDCHLQVSHNSVASCAASCMAHTAAAFPAGYALSLDLGNGESEQGLRPHSSAACHAHQIVQGRWLRDNGIPANPAAAAAAAGDPASRERLKHRLLAEDASRVPLLQTGLLLGVLLAVAVANITAGLLLPCGQWRYWVVVLSPIIIILSAWLIARRHILWKYKWKQALALETFADLKWDARNTLLYPAICISSGVMAGLLGLGGGLVLTPLTLELGVHPAVSLASTQVSMMISNSTSAILYAVNGVIPWHYGYPLVIIGFLSTLVGQVFVAWVVKRSGRSSLLVMISTLMLILAFAAALVVVAIEAGAIAKDTAKLTEHKAMCP